ncbi:MAG: hypothetical protein NWQ23_00970 [Yoonia sp.]|uniref:hypothetical protein n=1 Tax=Yoonia sp. TaxID=2212373 RepID=UPI00273E99ED|nr:hypothetical protein [Yoonia sp.]MDP5083959.1 hypothetical protein [Yoonia sp.]
MKLVTRLHFSTSVISARQIAFSLPEMMVHMSHKLGLMDHRKGQAIRHESAFSGTSPMRPILAKGAGLHHLPIGWHAKPNHAGSGVSHILLQSRTDKALLASGVARVLPGNVVASPIQLFEKIACCSYQKLRPFGLVRNCHGSSSYA